MLVADALVVLVLAALFFYFVVRPVVAAVIRGREEKRHARNVAREVAALALRSRKRVDVMSALSYRRYLDPEVIRELEVTQIDLILEDDLAGPRSERKDT